MSLRRTDSHPRHYKRTHEHIKANGVTFLCAKCRTQRSVPGRKRWRADYICQQCAEAK